uniref:DnaJ-like subfamily C member 28 n=1 Tax=Callorhinchus milii TaxID=7868 RepID=V9KWK2_CALMI
MKWLPLLLSINGGWCHQYWDKLVAAKRRWVQTRGQSIRFASRFATKQKLRDSYCLLQLEEEDCGPEQVKEAYLKLAKLYHPDSGSITVDPKKFVRVKEAYKAVLRDLAEKRNVQADRNKDDDEEERFKHIVPQHRHYLNFEGVGSGTPSQREKQYRKFRVNRANDQVLEYRKRRLESQDPENTMMVKDMQRSKKIKITQAVDRLVEDLIQESLAKGEFDNLSGKGKPLQKFSQYPYLDPMTHNLNRILIDNGYQPEWIVFQKEIKETIEQLRNDMMDYRKKLGEPLTPHRQELWTSNFKQFKSDVKKLNKTVDKFNLVVPLLTRQMLHFNPDKELTIVLKKYDALMEIKKTERVPIEEGGTVGLPKLFDWIKQFLK